MGNMVRKNSVVKMVEELLNKVGKPLHYKEITKQIMDKCNLSGKTPHETVRSLIGTNPKFIRVAEGVYALAKWKGYSRARFAKDIAYDVLKSYDKPMSQVTLGEKILAERSFVGGAKQVMRNVVRSDSRFKLDSENGTVSLVEWENDHGV